MAGPGRPGRPRGTSSTRGRGGRPPGRPRQRRDSNSTVASVDISTIRYLPETSVLKKTKIMDPDEWPCFVLKDAVVYRKLKGGQLQIANVCNVDLEGPFVVRGRLELDPSEEKQYLRHRDMVHRHIEIAASVNYAVGIGPWPMVWIGGLAGWFELHPAAEYTEMYDTVCEGISLYYSVMEVYLEAKAPKKKKDKYPNHPIERVLFKYAVANGDGLTLPEAQQRAHKHALFLLSQFPKEPDIEWSKTTFQRWLTKENMELRHKLDDAALRRTNTRLAKNSPSLKQPESSPESDSKSAVYATKESVEDVQMKDAQPSPPIQPQRVITPILPPRPGQAPPGHRAAPMPPGPSANTADSGAQPEDPVRFLMDLFEDILDVVGDISKVTQGTIHSKMYLMCSIKDYHCAKDITHYYAKRLVASLNPKWYDSPFWKWLKPRCNEPWSSSILKESEVPGQCVRRKKASTTRAPVAGKHLPSTPRPSGKNAVLRPGGSSKRPKITNEYEEDDYDDDDENEDRPSKMAKTSDDDDVSDDEEAIDISSDAAPAPISYSTTPIPIPTIPKETVRVVVRAEPLPSTSPLGINGTWKCQEEGCNYIVRAAQTKEGREEISTHFKDHAKQADKINLALAEGTRGHLPINHLLEKIRALGESSKSEAKPSDSDGYPKPIKRRLLI